MPRAGASRWANLEFSHELYNAGHLYEAAVAHHRATGKRTLLDVAIRNADLVDAVFGPDGVHDVPGHEEIEIGLIRLFHEVGERRYLDLAAFFLQQRGRLDQRPERIGAAAPAAERLHGEPWYRQDHQPVIEQREAVGHAVRAGYLYTGMADAVLADAETAGASAAAMRASLETIWKDVVSAKLYVTGGIGAHHDGERFGERFHLPNATAYAETCAAIANVMWNHRMFLLSGESRYLDVLERTLYNGLLSGISLIGDRFFYTNPLESDGRYEFNRDGSATRNPWFRCSCCPTNIVRFLPALPGYVYAGEDDRIYLNIFADGRAKVETPAGPVRLTQRTRYPWDGGVAVTVDAGGHAEFELAVRIPGWARDQPVPGDLYRYLDAGAAPGAERLMLAVNDTPVDTAAVITDGWAVIRRRWQRGDVVHLRLPMPVRRVASHPAVAANTGKVAVSRGPLVYCAEGIDNGGSALHLTLADDDPLAASFDPDLLGGIVVIRRPTGTGRPPLTLIPYYARGRTAAPARWPYGSAAGRQAGARSC